MLTHGTEYFVTWRNNLPCVHGWTIIMDEKLKRIKWMINENRWTKKRMKETYSQPKIMCQSKLYLFTTKRYVLIETPPIHPQEVCVSQNINSSSPRNICQSKHHLFISKRYVPISNWNNMKPHIFYTILNLFLIWIQSFRPFMFRVILAAWIIKLHFFPLST